MKKSLKIILKTIIFLLGFSFCLAQESYSRNKDFKVVIDAGHGGKDVGATDNGVKEKDINLKVALKLNELLKNNDKGIDVILTRKDDTYLTLQERADIANKAKGDLFISIHTNSVDKKNKKRTTIEGSSVYALGLHKDDNNMQVARRENSVIELESDYQKKYSGFDPSKDESYIIFEMAQKKNLSQSIKFAEDVEKELVSSGRADRGVHQAGFWVLWATSMPAVLIELDFICNPVSAKYISSDKGAQTLAEAIMKSITRYAESWNKNNSLALESDGVKGNEIQKNEISQKPVSARKRRNEKSKNVSASQNYETAFIPLETEQGKINENIQKDLPGEIEILNTTSKEKKKATTKKEKKENSTRKSTHKGKVEKLVTVYKIQILVSSELLKQNNPRFQGLSPITTYKDNDFYKYYFGESTDKEEINKMLKEVRKKIPDAFIVSNKKTLNSQDK